MSTTRLEAVDKSEQTTEELLLFARNFAAEADRLEAVVKRLKEHVRMLDYEIAFQSNLDTQQYRLAPGGEGEHAATWKDKPHRLVYDLCDAVERLRRQVDKIPKDADGDPIEDLRSYFFPCANGVLEFVAYLGPRCTGDVTSPYPWSKAHKTQEAIENAAEVAEGGSEMDVDVPEPWCWNCQERVAYAAGYEKGQGEITKLKAEVKRLQKGINAVSALIADSAGVDGLHLNGDVARWGELLAGGRDEIWLCAFSEAAKAEGGEA